MRKIIPDKKSVIWTADMRCFDLSNKFWYLNSAPISFFSKFKVFNTNYFWVRYISDFLNHYKSLELTTSIDKYYEFTRIFFI